MQAHLYICNNMEDKLSKESNGKKRQTKIEEKHQDSSFDSNPRSVGNASSARAKTWDNKIGVSREVSKRGNLSRSSISKQILGGTISQLIAKAEDQLAVLENSASETRKYITELKNFLAITEEIND